MVVLRRGAAQAARRARPRRLGARGVLLAPRWRATPSTRTTRGPRTSAAGACPRCCSPATTRRSAAGAGAQPRARGGGGGRVRYHDAPLARARSRPLARLFFAMSTVIECLERAQLRRVPQLPGRATACASTSRSSRARAGAPRSSRASSSSARATACARPSPSASSPSASAWSARSRCTRRRSSRSRSPPAATSGARSSTTCATASASAPASASAATPAPRRSSRPACSRPRRRAEAAGGAADAGGRRRRGASTRRGDRRGRRAAEAQAEPSRAAEARPPTAEAEPPTATSDDEGVSAGRRAGEVRGRLARRARPDRRGRARARARHPGLPGQAVPDPERVDGADAEDRPARARRPHRQRLRRSGVGDIIVFHPPAGAENGNELRRAAAARRARPARGRRQKAPT